MSMEPEGKHPHTGKPNMRYMTVVLELDDDAPEAAWRDVMTKIQLFEHLEFAPHCQVVGMGCGDAMAELEKLEEQA